MSDAVLDRRASIGVDHPFDDPNGGEDPVNRPPHARSTKIVVCCADFETSMGFYHELLGLPVVEQWDQAEGRGAILAVGDSSFVEVAAVAPEWPQHRPEFEEPLRSDKIVLQIRVDSTREWAVYLGGRCRFEGPVSRPWGNTYLYLRDPDGFRVALYEGDAAAVEWTRERGA